MEDISSGVANVNLEDLDGVDGGVDSTVGFLGDEENMNTDADISELPNIIIVTNLDDNIFTNSEIKLEFEGLFRAYDPQAAFQYLKSFRRARVVFESPLIAAKARIELHEKQLGSKIIKCYFAQPLDNETDKTSPNLLPPKPTKQFLISPPASPPIGWEPVEEGEPIINYDLLSAMAGLAPGESHELHPMSKNHPSIVVHICENPQGYDNRPSKIVQTKRPNMQ